MHSTNAERYLFLSASAGWRADAKRPVQTLTVSRDGRLGLQALPERAERLLEDNDEALLRRPSAVGFVRGRVVLADSRTNLLWEIALRPPPQAGEYPTPKRAVGMPPSVVPTIGTTGIEPRQFRSVNGVASLSNGTLVVADTDNHRLQIFSAPPYGLL